MNIKTLDAQISYVNQKNFVTFSSIICIVPIILKCDICYIKSFIIQLFPEGEVNSGGYIMRREASRYISTALHRP